MPKFIDLTGQRFGRLTVIERAENINGRSAWLCRCDCGNEVTVTNNSLRCGSSKSCGCLRNEQIIERNFRHGMHNTKIYRTWKDIKARCFNPNRKAYPNYGGRGITVYSEWINSFQAFYDYVSKLEHFNEEGYTLDRINNDGNYEPKNLRFTDRKAQARNRRTNIMVEYQGHLITLAEVSEILDIDHETLRGRYLRGDRGERLFRPVIK